MSRHRAGGPGVDREAAVLDAAVPGALGAELRARGDRSVLYRVVEADGTSVAVKMIAAESLGIVDRVRSSTPDGAGLVPVLRSGVHDGLGYLVMPYLPTSLADRIDGTPVSAGELARLLGPAATALARLHDAGFVHGDVKPANLLLAGPDGPALLADLDAVIDRGTVPVRFTPGFAAPEWAEGARATVAADTYGFAATVATALLGGTSRLGQPAEPADSRGAAEVALPESLPVAPRAAITLGLSADPVARVISASGIVAALAAGGGPDGGGSDGGGAFDRSAATVTPARRVLTPVPAAGRGDGTPALTAGQPAPLPAGAPAATAGGAPAGPHTDELLRAAQQVWGFVDLRAATRDRLPLQLQPPAADADPADEAGDRSIWRHPAMITSLVLAGLLVVLSVVLLVV